MTGLAQLAVFCLIFGGSVIVAFGLVIVMTMDIAGHWTTTSLMTVWVVFGWLFFAFGVIFGLIALIMLAFS